MHAFAAPPLPTAPGQSVGRGYAQPPSPVIDHSELPDEAPFKAFVGNLSHTIDSADIGQFFAARLQVRNWSVLVTDISGKN